MAQLSFPVPPLRSNYYDSWVDHLILINPIDHLINLILHVWVVLEVGAKFRPNSQGFIFFGVQWSIKFHQNEVNPLLIQ